MLQLKVQITFKLKPTKMLNQPYIKLHSKSLVLSSKWTPQKRITSLRLKIKTLPWKESASVTFLTSNQKFISLSRCQKLMQSPNMDKEKLSTSLTSEIKTTMELLQEVSLSLGDLTLRQKISTPETSLPTTTNLLKELLTQLERPELKSTQS
jgi:hypothetical protein